jgi:hypothetical protein
MELMVKGRTKAVLKYSSSVEGFWEYEYKCLPKWKESVRNGEIPGEWSKLEY